MKSEKCFLGIPQHFEYSGHYMVKFSLNSFLKFSVKSFSRIVYLSTFNACASLTFIELAETCFNYRKYYVESKKQNQRNLDLQKVIPIYLS